MGQHIPDVSENDVLRVVRRDFGGDRIEEIVELLSVYSSELGRVHLAVLKLSGGDLKKLYSYIEAAETDYRDVLSWAEYPNYGKVGWSDISKMSEEEKNKIYEKDKTQYEEWLHAS